MGNKGGKQGDLVKFYEVKEKLGSGSFATVHRARRKADGQFFAVKTILKNKLDEEAMENLRYEVEIMAKIDHPNVVRFIEMFETPKKLHLVMELLTGGELFDRITEKKTFSEKEAADVIRAITSAMSYLHSIGITHRDLKPENLIYATPAEDAPVKVIDFGLANFRPYRHTLMITPCGTPGYVAPEVLKGEKYTPQVDLWSIGVILYVLLCGYPPFYSKCVKKLYRKIMSGDYSFPSPHWDEVSDAAKDLIRGLMTVDPAARFTCEKVLQHPWISGASNKPLSESRSQLLRLLQARRRLRKVVHKLIAIQKIKFLIDTNEDTPPAIDTSDLPTTDPFPPPLLTIIVDPQETNTITPRHVSTQTYFPTSDSHTTPASMLQFSSPSAPPGPRNSDTSGEWRRLGESTFTSATPSLSEPTATPTATPIATPTATPLPASRVVPLSTSSHSPQTLFSPSPIRRLSPPSVSPFVSPTPTPTVKIHRKGGDRRASSPSISQKKSGSSKTTRRSSSPHRRKSRRPSRPPPAPPGPSPGLLSPSLLSPAPSHSSPSASPGLLSPSSTPAPNISLKTPISETDKLKLAVPTPSPIDPKREDLRISTSTSSTLRPQSSRLTEPSIPPLSKKEDSTSFPPTLETGYSSQQLDLLCLQSDSTSTVSPIQQISPATFPPFSAQNSPISRYGASTTDGSISQSDESTLTMSPIGSIPPIALFSSTSPTLPPPLISRFDDSEPGSPGVDRHALPCVIEGDESSPPFRDESYRVGSGGGSRGRGGGGGSGSGGEIDSSGKGKNDLKERTPRMVGSLLVLQ